MLSVYTRMWFDVLIEKLVIISVLEYSFKFVEKSISLILIWRKDILHQIKLPQKSFHCIKLSEKWTSIYVKKSFTLISGEKKQICILCF
jgi:hypothetical protein